MPQVCRVCSHKRRVEIDVALVGGKTTIRALSTLYHVSEMSLARHRDKHIPAELARATNATEVAQAGTLLDQIKDLQRKTLEILNEAEGPKYQLPAIREARSNIELLARLTNELPSSPTVINILLTDEWISLRSTIVQALDPYPDAIEAVSRAISR